MLDFLWALVVWLVQMAGAWVLAGMGLLLPLLRTDFSRFALARSFATAAVVLAFSYRYGFATDGLLGLVDAIIAKYLVMGAVAAVALVVLGTVYVALGRPGARGSRLGRLFIARADDSWIPGPLVVMLLLLATTGFLAWVIEATEGYENGFISVMSFLIVFLPALVFLLIVPFSVAGTVFNAATPPPPRPWPHPRSRGRHGRCWG